jgi:hypothetical protein
MYMKASDSCKIQEIIFKFSIIEDLTHQLRSDIYSMNPQNKSNKEVQFGETVFHKS